MEYTNNMGDVSFALDPKGGEEILQDMAMSTVKQSAEAIANRTRNMSAAMTSKPPEVTVSATVGTIKRGTRAIATVRVTGVDAHANYIGHQALAKSKDAGRVS